jgi:hypothetical protein
VQSGPFYKEFIVDDQIAKTGYFQRQLESHSTLISSGAPIFLEISPAFRHPVHESIGAVHPGVVAFFPVPARTAITCGLPDADDPKTPSTPILLSPPQSVYLYTESHFLDPQRDFLTSPQGGLSFSSGFIVGHKYTDQSAAKTVVDTVTQPIRSLMPSVSVSEC